INPNCRKSLLLKEVIAYRYKQDGKKSSISVDPPLTSVEFVTGILEANPRSSHPTWGIEKVPDWAHPITPKKYSQHTSEKTTPLDSIEELLSVSLFSMATIEYVFVICYGISFFRPK
ncbi:mitochondrial fission 1 protein A, partial [Tanacetum coccineum]